MKLTQVTHHDLDGYGAATVVRAHADVDRVVHVSRYADVGPVVEAELGRLRRTEEAEMLVVTDIGLEPVAVAFIKSFVAMNAKREPDRAHKLVVLDHHASSIDQLTRQGFAPSTLPDAADMRDPTCFSVGDPKITVIVDESRCATRLAYDHRDLYATMKPATGSAATLGVLIAAIDAVDLWRKDDPIFRQALVLDEVFWDNVSGFVPLAHPWHEAFVGDLLLGMAARLGEGVTPAGIERDVGVLRTDIIDAMLAGEPDDDHDMTARMRLAPALARSPDLFRRIGGGAKLSFGLDAGTFQRASDVIMANRDAKLVVNVQRNGAMSFRSNDGSALEAARKFGGGGHGDAAGGRLTTGTATSIAEAIALVEPILDPPKSDRSNSPFAALRNFKA